MDITKHESVLTVGTRDLSGQLGGYGAVIGVMEDQHLQQPNLI